MIITWAEESWRMLQYVPSVIEKKEKHDTWQIDQITSPLDLLTAGRYGG